MTNIDLDIDTINVREAIDDLEDSGTSDREYNVSVGAEYGKFLEFGTRNMPPYPFFRPAIREFRLDPEIFLRTNQQTTPDEIESVDALVENIAFGLENQMTLNATAAASFGRSPGTDAEHPLRQTGNLAASIQAQRIR
jgi:hypothetical protein